MLVSSNTAGGSICVDMNYQQFPPPMFTSASAAQHGDDFDFHEVFAEYFNNEFQDPFNAYTAGMANYNPVASIPMSSDGVSDLNAGQGQNSMGLPTGGIKTAFHATAVSPMIQPSFPPQPGAKKHKTEEEAILGVEALNLSSSQQPQTYGNEELQQQQPTIVTSSDLNQPTTAFQFGNDDIRANLPVGVGIRLGTVVPTAGTGGGFNFGQMGNNNASEGGGNASFVWNMFNNNQGVAGSNVAVAERRERNREHAKRSRVRKKFILESLQEQVRQLQRENGSLRLLVQEHIPENAMQIFDECCTKNILFAETDGSGEGGGGYNNSNISDDQNMGGQSEQPPDHGKTLVRSDFSLMQSLTAGQKCFVLSDPKLPDNPIVFATPDFYTLTGYTAKEVLGRNCRFLQGPGTDKRAVDVIRKACEVGADCAVCLLNYKADGTPFWNQLFIGALRDADNNIVNYVGVQTVVEPESTEQSYLEDKVNMVLPLVDRADMRDEDDMDDD